MAPPRTPGFFERALARPKRRRAVSEPIEEPGEVLDLSTSPRTRYAEAGELASGGFGPRDWGLGVGVRSNDYDYATEHAAMIRAISRFGITDVAPRVAPSNGPWTTARRPIDEFDFAAYPRGVRTWTEDHPAWYERARRSR